MQKMAIPAERTNEKSINGHAGIIFKNIILEQTAWIHISDLLPINGIIILLLFVSVSCKESRIVSTS